MSCWNESEVDIRDFSPLKWKVSILDLIQVVGNQQTTENLLRNGPISIGLSNVY